MSIEVKSSQQEGVTYTRDWTKGSVIGNLLRLSWPMVMMESLWVVSQIVDLIWVGRLGSNSIAGVGIANIILMLVYSVDMGLLVGVRAMIARFAGAGDPEGANRVAGQAIVLGVCCGTVITVAGVLFCERLLGLFGADAAVVAQGTAYLRVMFAGWVGMELMVMGLYSIQSAGDTVTPMVIEAVIRVFHIALCPFLVLGWWIFPRMGVSGAALSNVLAQVLGSITVLLILFRGHTRIRLMLSDLRIAPKTIWRILKIGVPALVMNLQSAFGSMLFMRLIVPFGTLALAAHSLAGRVEMFLFVPGMGLGMGAGVLVGHNLGARQPSRAQKSAWLAVSLVEGFMAVCCIVILVWAEQIIGIFSSEPDLRELGSTFMRIAAAGYLLSALSSVMQSCIAGAGDTLPNMIVSIAMVWAVQLPLAFLLSRETSLGIYGIRWALVITTFVGAVAYTTYFIAGKWKTKKV
jgi:putative MATE family efflux protein